MKISAHAPVVHPAREAQPLRVLTFNLQVGISTHAWYQYLTHSWQHVLPNSKRQERLSIIGRFLSEFDIVGLQEVDGGSFRSGNVNQIDFLAQQAGAPYHYQQLNRNLGKLAQHSNGLLSRYRPSHVDTYRLPGPPGRGVMRAQYGEGDEALHLFVAHLALGIRTQKRQLDFLCELMSSYRHVILVGDLNCTRAHLEQHTGLSEVMSFDQMPEQLSYPAWQPKRALDHILISPTLQVANSQVLPPLFSDHLPLAADIILPPACHDMLVTR